MGGATLQSLADGQVLHLTTVGRVSGLPREIEIWFIVWREKFYLFSEHREAAGWVKNHPPQSGRSASVLDGAGFKALARVLDYRKDRELWDEVQAIADRKYGWGDGLPVEIAPLDPE